MANNRDIINNQNSGFFQDLVLRLKLILRLMGDRRVNLLLKLLPIAAAIYVISPVDLIPGAVIPVNIPMLYRKWSPAPGGMLRSRTRLAR
jgi:hypothetical protein